MYKKQIKKMFLLFLIGCLVCATFDSTTTAIAAAASKSTAESAPSDLKGHWAEQTLSKWLSDGLINGYRDGTIRPDRALSRGEAMALANRSFGFSEKASIHFTDLPVTSWAYADVAKAVHAGYIAGYVDGTIKVNQTISRQEAAVIIARILALETGAANETAKLFLDAGEFPKWSKGAIAAVAAAQFMKGYTDGTFRPGASITRAEFVVALDRALSSNREQQYSEAGVYGPAAGQQLVNGNVVVSVPGVTLQNMRISGDLLLAEGIAEGEVYLNNVTVQGTTTVSGGGINSIHFNNSVLATVIVDKASGKKVRIVVEGKTTITELILKSAGILDVGKEARILSLILHAIASVKGLGVIEKATISETAKGTTFETRPLQLTEPANSGQNPPPVTETPTPGSGNLIVENGVARATLVVDTDASDEVLNAAESLKKYVMKSTGANIAIKTVAELANETAGNHSVKIYIGVSRTADNANHQALLDELNEEGFIIDSKENNITIIGSTSWGTAFGVYEFLERYVGVRWLMPLPNGDGEDVPESQDLMIKYELVRDQPASLSRHIFGTEHWVDSTPPARGEWAKFNRMYDLFWSARNHNMWDLFAPAKFADHPEYYPDGVIPTSFSDWQPCYSNPNTIQAAIDTIIQYFEDNPRATAYSLGINDGANNFCESDASHPYYPNKKNSIGLQNMSDIYYPWVNAVVEGVLEQYPNKYFTVLAYGHVYDTPDIEGFELNSQVIPYITDDRHSWIDSELAGISKQHNLNWEQVASQIGWYDYLYGTQYLLPRIYPHTMADNYRYAKDHKVVGHIAEWNPSIGEGPKAWLSTKLQWDPDQDVDALLDEWYERAVGAEAATYLKQYYDLFEQFWTTTIFDTEWFNTWKDADERSNYMEFTSYSYLKEISKQELAEARDLMEQTVASAVTDLQKKRAGLLLRAFEYYEASALSYPKGKAIVIPSTEEAALNLLEDATISINLGKRRVELLQEFQTDWVMITQPVWMMESWSGMPDSNLIPAINAYIMANEPSGGAVTNRLNVFFEEFPIFNVSLSANAVKTTATKAEILQSLDFSQGPWTVADPFSDFMKLGTIVPSSEETKVYLLWDDEYLYVGYENFDSDISSPNFTASDSAPGSWWPAPKNYDDSVETYITEDPEGTYNGYFTNPKAVKFVYNKKPGNDPAPAVDLDWEANSEIKSDRWNTVQAIPFSSIGIDPDTTDTLKGYFLRAYHGATWYAGWGGGATWNSAAFKPIHLVENQENLIPNGSFEDGNPDNAEEAPPWYLDKYGTGDTFSRTSERSRTGDFSLVGDLSALAEMYQDIPITPGTYRAVYYYFIPEDSGTSGGIQLNMNVKTATYILLTTEAAPFKMVADTKGLWTKVSFDFEVSSSYGGGDPARIQPLIDFWGFKRGEKIYIDDISLIKLD